MNLSEVSEYISNVLTEELDYSNDKKEIVAYGIESVILTIIGFLAILLLAFFFKAVIPTVIAALFGGFLRRVSGGAHFDTPLKCLTFGAIIYSLLGVIAKEIIIYDLYTTTAALLILVLSLIVIVLFAPVDCEAKPIHSLSFRRKLKIASVGFVVLTMGVALLNNNALVNTSAVLGIGYQTMTLLPVFNKKKKEG